VKKLIKPPELEVAKTRALAVVSEPVTKVPVARDETALLGDLRTLVQSA